MQIEELPTSDDDDDDIKTPDEPPAKGPIKLTAWAASASPKRTVAHMMMFPMISNQSPSGSTVPWLLNVIISISITSMASLHIS
jgi:hypothetical protein